MTTGPNDRLTVLPYPTLPANLSALPIYSVAGNIFMVDDTGGQLTRSPMRMSNAMVASTLQAQDLAVANLIASIQDDGLWPGGTNGGAAFYSDSFDYHLPTNGLWLETLNTNPVTTNLWLRLHGTVGGNNYQLLSTPDLNRGYWDLGEILLGASDGYTDFSPVPMTNDAAFFWAHHANPIMAIWNAQGDQNPFVKSCT